VTGHTGRFYHSQIGAIINIVNMATGRVKPRLLLGTDRYVYVTSTGFTNARKPKEVLAMYPAGSADLKVSKAWKLGGFITVNGETIEYNRQSDAAQELARIASGTAGEPVSGG
jgi:hypothetical protein